MFLQVYGAHFSTCHGCHSELWLQLQDKIEKTLIEVSFPAFSVLRNFDDVLRICYLKCQPFLAEAWPS